MIARVAIVPSPPLLVPQLAAGAVAETQPLREACLAAARALRATACSWVAVGRTDPTRTADAVEAGTFRGYGVDVPVRLTPRPAAARPDVELPFLIAGWLRDAVGPEDVVVRCVPIGGGSTTAECVSVGHALTRSLAEAAEPVGLLVLGDGAATHSLRAPGYFDRRAAGFERAAVDALTGPDLTGLLNLDCELAGALGVAGREAWQVAAAAAESRAAQWRGQLLFSDIPYGVAYHVAVWDPAS